MLANCSLLANISMSSNTSSYTSQGCTSFPLCLPPWNTVGVSGHSFHYVRTGLRSEEPVNGHLEVAENICLWRHSGLVIPQWDSASHASLYTSTLFFFFQSKFKSCRYLSICQPEKHHQLIKYIYWNYCSFHFRIYLCSDCFPYFPLYSMFFLSRASHQDLELGTQLQWLWRLWLNSKPGVRDVWECSVSPVSPQDQLDWSAHFQNALLSWPDCCLAAVKPAPYISSTLQLTLQFTVFVFYYMLYLFFYSQLWGH